jgi:hypothetical protein
MKLTHEMRHAEAKRRRADHLSPLGGRVGHDEFVAAVNRASMAWAALGEKEISIQVAAYAGRIAAACPVCERREK